MKIFVTGATGFIGARVAAELKSKHTVHLLKHRLHELAKIEKDLKKFKPDVVIHLAWEGIPDYGVKMAAKNLRESLAFFELVGSLKIPKLLSVGSAWQHESQEELKGSNHRAFITAKNALQIFGEESMKLNRGTFVWAVLFFSYGMGKKEMSLIPSLIAQAKGGSTPTPRNPDAWHDFIYVDDVAQAIALLATKKVLAGSYDIGTGTLTRTGEIARIVSKLSNLPQIKLKKISKVGKRADIRPLQKATGWKPRVTIKEGLSRMLHPQSKI